MLSKLSNIVGCISIISSIAGATPLKNHDFHSNSSLELIEFGESGESGWGSPVFPYFHQSCNATNQRMLSSGLKDTLEVTAVTRDKLLANGTDKFFKRWFGNSSVFTVIGTLEYVIESGKSDVLYRCDDPSGDCAVHSTDWPGYHVTNTTGETNICDLFYQTKKPLSTICFEGDIVELGPKHYSGIDLFHRFLHLDNLNGNGFISEWTETLPEVLYLAENNATFAARNTDNYLYYLADVYAATVNPGGCLGELPKAERP